MKTRELYERVARTLSFMTEKYVKGMFVAQWVNYFERDNPKFDKEKFIAACNHKE